MEKVYSASRRRTCLKLRVKDAIEIAPVRPSDRADEPTTDLRGWEKSPDSYRIVYRNEGGEAVAILIEVSAKLVKMMAKYNPKTVVIEELRY